jgi:hypothetical protein
MKSNTCSTILKFKVLGLTESFLNNVIDDSLFVMPGYKIERLERVLKGGGGIFAIFMIHMNITV